MTNQIELTTKKTSYVHSLFEHRDEITKKFESKQVNTNQLKQFVREIVINTNSKNTNSKTSITVRP